MTNKKSTAAVFAICGVLLAGDCVRDEVADYTITGPSTPDTVAITVDAGQTAGTWNRFYEQLISTDHMVTMLHSAYGRNMQNALKRCVDECGFKYFRGHGIFNGDIGVYSEPGGVSTYNWTTFDSVYDAAKAIGIRPIVEFSFTPPEMASGTGVTLWYNGVPAKITPPRDYNKLKDLCYNVVVHCQARYGVEEVRKWLFEVYNEPDLGTFWLGTQSDYFKLYDYASEGVRLADSLCKVGGPATSATNPSWIDAFLTHVLTGTNEVTGKTGSKCDFISYHRYADDPGFASGLSNPESQNLYHQQVVNYCNAHQFKGLIINNEWGPCAIPSRARDNESTASFIVQTIHLLASNGVTPPAMYGYWCVSDIYEEMNAWSYGVKNAYDEGNYGIMLRGDANIPDSWDVGKPAFNAFKLLHKMGDVKVAASGGSAGGANAFATLSQDNSAVQVMVYDHSGTDDVKLTINNIPFTGPARVEHFLIDSAHSNSYRVWVGMGKPKVPTAAQWTQLKAAAELAYADPVDTVALGTLNSFSKSFTARKNSVSLFVISNTVKAPELSSKF